MPITKEFEEENKTETLSATMEVAGVESIPGNDSVPVSIAYCSDPNCVK